jgi:divalent metal cation (Fe/Co/Zn/Cd) transporter
MRAAGGRDIAEIMCNIFDAVSHQSGAKLAICLAALAVSTALLVAGPLLAGTAATQCATYCLPVILPHNLEHPEPLLLLLLLLLSAYAWLLRAGALDRVGDQIS